MRSNSKKLKIYSICFSLLFVLTTAIGLLALPLRNAQAATVAAGASTLKFKQVAAGEDFAIALTYGGDLYAWSLLDKDYRDTSSTENPYPNGNNKYSLNGGTNPNGATLGVYYPSNPIKLHVAFTGIAYDPSGNDICSSVSQAFAEGKAYNYWGSGGKYGNDSIVQIAATRTTAAFITKMGFIYTWGAEVTEPAQGGTVSSYLLLRAKYGSSTEEKNINYNNRNYLPDFVPAMIDYSDAQALAPTNKTLTAQNPGETGLQLTSISASETNYTVSYTSGTDTTYLSSVWGQGVYSQLSHQNSYDFLHKPKIQNEKNRVYVGDGNVYYISGSSLYVRGKNYNVLDNASVQEGSEAATITGLYNTFTTATGATTRLARTSTPFTGASEYANIGNAIISGGTESEGSSALAGTAPALANNTAIFYTSDADVANDGILTTGDVLQNITAPRSTFAAGDGFGYMLSSNAVYFWGDNTWGQSGSMPSSGIGNEDVKSLQSLNLGSTSYVQVVVGHASVAPAVLLEGYDTSSSMSTAIKDKWTTSGSQTVLTNATVTDPGNSATTTYTYVGNHMYINALLSGTGNILAFGTYQSKVGETAQFFRAAVDLSAYRVNTSTGSAAENRIIAIAGGYGNNLFAISSLGKIYRISVSGVAAGNSATYNVQLYDNFYDSVYNSGNSVDEEDPVKIDNWTTTDSSKVTFTTGYYVNGKSNSAVEVRIGGMTAVATEGYEADDIHVDNIGTKNNATQSAPITTNNPGAIDRNNSGDAYRMILPKLTQWQQKSGDTVTKTGVTVSQWNDNTQWTPVESSATLPTFDNAVTGILGNASSDIGKLTFTWVNTSTNNPINGAKEIETDVVFRYFDIEYRYNVTTREMYFVIVPKQATPDGQSIKITYWIGRYDTLTYFSTTTASHFYDFKTSSVTVTIQNTAHSEVYTSMRADEQYQLFALDSEGKNRTTSNSAVPLLDANNPYNNTYSIAVMDVSTGIDKVAELLGNQLGSTIQKQSIYDMLRKADSGFPAADKIEKGSLSYYNYMANKYYDNTYRYFVADHDGDIVKIDNVETFSESYSTYFNYAVQYIDAFLECNIPSNKVSDLKYYLEKTTENGNVLGFDNKYGLQMWVVTQPAEGATDANWDKYEKSGILFRYQVLTVEAISSMGSRYVSYDMVDIVNSDNTKTTVYDVQRPITTIPSSPDMTTLRLTFNGTIMDGTSNMRRTVEVFTQSSLTIKEIAEGGDITVGNTEVGKHEVFGGATAIGTKSNECDYKLITLQLGEGGTGVTGMNTDNYVVDLGEFVKDIATYSPSIRISYQGGTEQTAWDSWAATFGSGVNPIELTVNTARNFTIRAYRAASNITFRLEIRRTVPDNVSATFRYGISNGNAGKDAEVIYVNFTVKVNFDKEHYFSLKGTPDTPDTVTVTVDPVTGVEKRTTEFAFSKRMNLHGTYLLSRSTISVKSSDASILDAAPNTNNTAIVLTPKSSGTVWVSYTIYMYGKQAYIFKDSFPVTVKTLSSMEKEVRVIETREVSISDLQGYLERANDLEGVTGMELDWGEGANRTLPYYFQTTEGKSSVDAENEWKDVSEISFLSSVYLGPTENSPTYIGMKIGTYDSSTVSPTSRIVVKFKDSNGAKYEVSFRVTPAAVTLNDSNSTSGSTLAIEISKNDEVISILNRNDPVADAQKAGLVADGMGRFEIGVNYLKGLIHEKDADKGNSKTYYIIAAKAVSADGLTDYSKYYNVTTNGMNADSLADAVLITPLYPTQELSGNLCNLQISLQNKDTGEVTLVNLNLRISGIQITLSKSQYQTIILAVFFSVLAVQIIVFVICMGVYWKRKADQRRIIKKNQAIIKMRDKMHSKTETVSKEKLVRTKLKMEDPKYARMFNEMRQEKEAQTGISLDNSPVAKKADKKAKAAKAAKKKGKKSIDELRAELAAKQDAVARMQMGDFSDMPEDMAPVDVPVEGVPIDPMMGPESIPVEEVPVYDAGAGFDGMNPDAMGGQFQDGSTDDIVFEPINPDDDGNGN